jgi:hypothetical protein
MLFILRLHLWLGTSSMFRKCNTLGGDDRGRTAAMTASLPQLAAADQKDGRANQSHASTGEGSGVGPVYQVLGTEICQLLIET